jgi:hypothetical protein
LKGLVIPSDDRPCDKEGWHVDNKGKEPYGWYGFIKKEGEEGGFADRLKTGVQPYIPGKTKVAELIDNPEPGEADRQQVFITCAVIKGGRNNGKILGCIIFGQKTDGNGNWDKELLLPPKYFDYPPPEFFSAVKVHNADESMIQLPKLSGEEKGAPKKSPY